MTDTPTPPAPDPAPKKRATPGDIDKQLLANIKLGEDMVEVATDAAHAEALDAEEIDPAAVGDLPALAAHARELAAKIPPAKRTFNAATAAEKTAYDALMAALRDIQKRAKRKFEQDKTRQAAYSVGKNNFGKNRTTLEQDAETIFTLATADVLPGLPPAKLTTSRGKLAAWKQADETQAKAAEAQTKAIQALETAVQQINTHRREIQRCADLAWPHTDPASAPYRRAFQLPVNKPFGV